LTNRDFSSLALDSELLSNLPSLGYEYMTPIQEQSLPHILAGNDIIAQGKTGSGKTAAFGLGLLTKLDKSNFHVQSLVLCPTRELTDQVANELRRLARTIPNVKVLTLCGGLPFGPQAESIASGVHIIIGTPGRVEDHLRKRTLNLGTLKIIVLDEADRMLDMGFQETLDTIIEQVPKQRQTLLFSATFPSNIKSIAKRIMNNPVKLHVESVHDNITIKQHFYKVRDANKVAVLCKLILQSDFESVLIFCNTRLETQRVADELSTAGFSALALHGDFDQRDRTQTLVRFSNRSAQILVATDVAARGIDIDSLDAVINFQIATSPDMHVHRIGRTGRAGQTGIAITLFSEKDAYKAVILQESLGRDLVNEPLPALPGLITSPSKATMTTLLISAGKRQKIRPGDVLGALTGESEITGSQVGKIDIFNNRTYVAINREIVKLAIKKLADGKIKGRHFRVRAIY
jgi:ATP-independent RNA helicase DbpA